VTELNFGPSLTAWAPNWGAWNAADTALIPGKLKRNYQRLCLRCSLDVNVDSSTGIKTKND